MTIRAFSEADFPAIEAIYAASKLDELRFEARAFALLPLCEDARRLAALRESEIHVYDQGGIRAYGAVYQSEIRALFVHPAFRGGGVGRLLLEHLLEQAGAGATLYVAKSNHPAKALYTQYGFYDAAEFEAEYNGVAVTANKMQRTV